MKGFYEVINKRFGILPPTEGEQDWELTCGDTSQTGEYVAFYDECGETLNPDQKRIVINMIMQGFEELFPEIDCDKREDIWTRIRKILAAEKELFAKTIKYWASLRTSLEDAFHVSGYVRELARELNLEWNEVITEADAEDLNIAYDYFEDSVIVSMNYVSGNGVSGELVADMRGDNDLKIMFQRLDRNPFSIELWFTHARRMRFSFVNPSDNCQMDIMRAKICRNGKSVFWAAWDAFDPDNEEHLTASDVMFVESEGLKWRTLG